MTHIRSPRLTSSTRSSRSSTPLLVPRSETSLAVAVVDPPTWHQHAQSSRENASLAWKYFAFACSVFLGFGSHYAAHVLSALKPSLKEDFGINNAQYGVLQAAVSLVNTVAPLIGGRLIDVFGVSRGSMVSCSLITLGSLGVAASAHVRSFSLMVLGRLLYGLGSMVVITVQHTILSHWFRGSALSVTIGIQLATSRLASFLAMLLAIPLKEWTGWYGYSLWGSFFLCLWSWGVNWVYVRGMRRFYRQSGRALDRAVYGESLSKIHRKISIHWNDVHGFPLIYWTLVWLGFGLGGGWTVFLHISTDLMMKEFGVPESEAGTLSSMAQIVPVFLAPFLGYFIDRFGQHPRLLLGASGSMALSFGLLLSHASPPLIAAVIFSFSLSLGPVGMISAIGTLMSPDRIGTALGLYKALNNIASTILDPLLGWIQDLTQGYTACLTVLSGIAIISVVLSLGVLYLDFRDDHHLLSANQAERKRLLADSASQDSELESMDLDLGPNIPDGASTHRLGRWMMFAVYGWMVASWIVFLSLYRY